MARKKLTGIVLVGVIVLLAAIFATRLDLAALLVADTSSSLQPNKTVEATAEKPAAPAAAAQARSEERVQPEVRTAKATDATRSAKAPEASRPTPEVDRTPNSDGTKFDVVRIDPDGASVFAGRAPPHSRVTVYANDEPVTAATANAAGEWVSVIERPFPTGEVKLSLRAQPAGKVGAPAHESAGQSVRITIAASPPRPAATTGTRLATPARAAPTPSPITFVYDQDTFTDLGRKEAAVLREFLRQSNLESITLSGHADTRGSDDYNMELSRRRLEQVARFLREAGYTGKVLLEAKGSREPFATPGRERMPKEDAFQLDRRVELRANR